MYYLTRNAIETIILLALKQFCLCIYNEIEFDKCLSCFTNVNINCCGKYKDSALSITMHPIIIWKTRKKHPLLEDNTSYSYNHSDSCHSTIIKEGYVDHDFYHSKCCTSIWHNFNCCCCPCNRNYNAACDQTSLSVFFQSSRVWIPFGITVFICGTLQMVDDIINGNTVTSLTRILNMCQLLTLTGLILSILLSFNIKLFKLQLKEFETIYKLYNCVKIILCQISYDFYYFTQQNWKVNTKFYLSIIEDFMRSGILLLLVVTTSCIDAWPIQHSNYSYSYIDIKLVLLIVSFMVISYWYYLNAAYTTADDYFTINIAVFARISNGYETANYSYATLLAFLFKQICLLIYYRIDACCCCKRLNCKCKNFTFGQNKTRAVSIVSHPTVVWES